MNDSIVPVLLGGDSNVYGMARSFYEEYGATSYVVCKGLFHICRESKLITSVTVEPNFEKRDVFINTLLEFARSYKENGNNNGEDQNSKHLVLVPCADGYAKLLVDCQNELREVFDFSIMSPEVFSQISSKQRFYDTCEKYGLDYPGTQIVDSSNWKTFESPFGYPCIVKPSNSVKYWNCSYLGKKKAFEIRSRSEFLDLCKLIYSSDYDDSLIVQEYIPGDDSAMFVLNCYSNQEGKVTMMTLGRILLEEQTPMGIGSYGAIITDYDVDLCLKVKDFLETLGYVGFSNFDMKLDSRDGSYKFFEINPRQGRSSYYVTASGMNLAYYLIEDIVIHHDAAVEFAQPENRALWSAVPFCLIKKYVQNKTMLKTALKLKREHKFIQEYWAKYDKNFRRLILFVLNQVKQIQNYSRWFGKRHLDD